MRIRLSLAALAAALAVVCPAQATLTSTSSSVTYTGNGVTTAFTVPFKFLASGDLVVTVDNVTKTIATHYTVSGAGNATGTVTFLSAPANATAVVISRLVDYTQRTSLKGSRAYDPTNIETTFDKLTMEIQQLGSLSFDALTFTAAGSGAVARTATSKLRDIVNVKDFGALCDGATDDSAAFAAALAVGQSVTMPAGTCSLGTTGISLTQFSQLIGSGAERTILKYTGTGCAIKLDSVEGVLLANFRLNVLGTSATKRGICFFNATGNNLRNEVDNVQVWGDSANARIAGTYGVYVHSTTANSLYYMKLDHVSTAFWDVGFENIGDAATGGAQGNTFVGITGSANTTHIRFQGIASDNQVDSIYCNGGGAAVSQTCLVIGDGATLIAGNKVLLDADMGGLGKSFTINANAIANKVTSINESSIVGTDATAPTGTNQVTELKPGGSNSWAFGNVTITPGAITSGAGLSLVPADTSAATIGKSGALGKGSGVRQAAARYTVGAKVVAVTDCAAGNLTPTVSTVLDGGFFTCATAQTLTLPTAQGVNGLVQNLPGGGTINDVFEFHMAENHATNTFTLIAGTGGTIYGIATITNGSRIWRCKVTSVTVGSETYTCY